MNNGNENDPRRRITVESDHKNEDVDDDSASYHIDRSKELIRKLEQTAIHSATIVQRARSFHEMHKMLSVSKTMSANSRSLLKLASQKRSHKTDQLDSSDEGTVVDTSQSKADSFDD